ncbi:MAG: inositol monophosphatase family protein [Fimbriimonadaceae bacterium]|nr:inositol monophosphatase family protein [Fimbriimonadaceae bacterium]
MNRPLPAFELVVEAVEKAAHHAVSLQQGIGGELKADGSIVTQADREVETMLKEAFLGLTPGAGFWGEEFGFTPPTDAGFWVVDPIDGTSNYAHGQALWGVTAGYLRDGILEQGIIYMPRLNMMLCAERGGGATLNGKPMSPIPPGEIQPQQLVGHGDATLPAISDCPGKMRHLGAFVIEAAYVATQSLRAMTAGRVKLYDAAGGILICRELGAEIRELSGADWREADWQKESRCNPLYIGPRESNFPYGNHWSRYQ